MGPKGSCLQYLSICRKLFDTIMKSLAVQTSKTVKLGVPTQGTLPGIHPQHGQDPNIKQEARCADTVEVEESRAPGNSLPRTGSVSAEEDHKTGLDESLPPCVEDGGIGEGEEQEPGVAKGLKKAVSFHDEVEKIEPAKKKKKVMMRRTQTAGKPSSMEQDNEHLPLRSILKVSSDLTSASSPSTQ